MPAIIYPSAAAAVVVEKENEPPRESLQERKLREEATAWREMYELQAHQVEMMKLKVKEIKELNERKEVQVQQQQQELDVVEIERERDEQTLKWRQQQQHQQEYQQNLLPSLKRQRERAAPFTKYEFDELDDIPPRKAMYKKSDELDFVSMIKGNK